MSCNKKTKIHSAESSSIITNLPDILWINMEQITKLSKENNTLFSNTIIEEQFKIQIKKIFKKYFFKTIEFMDSNIHGTMAYHKPSF